MSKNKRRTRSQKIIAQLRRELKKQEKIEKNVELKPKIENGKKTKNKEKLPVTSLYPEHSARAVRLSSPSRAQAEGLRPRGYQLPINQLYPYDPSLIKKDLLKTFYLSLIFFLLIGLFYWYFEIGGENIIKGFFRL